MMNWSNAEESLSAASSGWSVLSVTVVLTFTVIFSSFPANRYLVLFALVILEHSRVYEHCLLLIISQGLAQGKKKSF